MSYEAAGGKLKLKGVSDHGVKKKKKKSKDKEQKLVDAIVRHDVEEKQPKKIHKTNAELAYEQATAKRQAETILQKASKSHKERIMELNSHLDSLTEHFDIPKVSWTK